MWLTYEANICLISLVSRAKDLPFTKNLKLLGIFTVFIVNYLCAKQGA